ncbi:DUF6694 family lipoprotein [Pseudoxanthomonas dokdonensis]|nr:DUF6694 family lipoprotein [Pseudoxanthomonas dokdonensis]
MLKEPLLAVCLAFAVTACATSENPASQIRLDATSDATAMSSFSAMAEALTSENRQELLVAMLKLNMTGVNSVYEVIQNPDLQSPSIARIKDKVDGMTAQQIIDLANRTSSVEAEVTAE